MPDLDKERDPAKHDAYNRTLSDEKVADSWKSRRERGKATWQQERDIDRRLRERG